MSISVVQSAKGTGTSLSFSGATTAGNCVVVFVYDVNVGSAPSVSAVTLGGAAGNFAAAATASNTGSFDALCTAWADPDCAGGQTAIAVTMANSGHPVIIAYEISGLATSSVIDKTSTGHGTAASWSSGTTATTTQAAEAWLGGCCVVNTAPTGPASPWSDISEASSTTDGIAGSQVTTSTGTATYSGTGGGSNGWAAVVITLLPNSGAITSSGGLTAGAPAMSGSMAVPVTSSGGLTAGAAAMSGTVTLPVPITASGGLTAGAPAMSGTGAMLVTASGGLRAAAAALRGSAAVQVPQLLLSIACAAGTDDYGNGYQAGATAYDVANGTWAQLDSAALNFANGATIANAVAGLLNIDNNGVAGIEINSNTDEIDLNANSVNVNGNSITGLFGNLDPSGLPLSGSATLSAVISAVNSMFQRLQAIGVFQ